MRGIVDALCGSLPEVRSNTLQAIVCSICVASTRHALQASEPCGDLTELVCYTARWHVADIRRSHVHTGHQHERRDSSR